LGEKVLESLLQFAREKRSRDVVDGLLQEMVILPAKQKKTKFKSKTSNLKDSEVIVKNGETIILSDENTIGKENSSTLPITDIGYMPNDEDRMNNRGLGDGDIGGETRVPDPKSGRSFPLEGSCVVFTGRMDKMTREDAEMICTELGERMCVLRVCVCCVCGVNVVCVYVCVCAVSVGGG
jgi:NAD-dependent DNA ligase